MTSQTCSVIVGFLCIHVALFLSIVTLNSSHFVSTCDDSTASSNYTNPKTTEVFWHICTCEGCSLLNTSDGLWYSHILFIVATGLLTLATLGMYFYLVLGCLNTSVAISVLSFINIILASLCLLSSLVLFRFYRSPVLSDSAVTQVVSWPFYVSLIVTVLTTVATMAGLERTRVICVHHAKGYSDVKN